MRQVKLDCSADPEEGAEAIPFMQRIRPGMVVQHNPKKYFLGCNWREKKYAMILSPASAVDERVCDLMGKRVESKDEEGKDRGGRYLAAIITPSLLPGSFLVNLWKQIVVNADEIEAEVLMEYDEATRYYYLTL